MYVFKDIRIYIKIFTVSIYFNISRDMSSNSFVPLRYLMKTWHKSWYLLLIGDTSKLEAVFLEDETRRKPWRKHVSEKRPPFSTHRNRGIGRFTYIYNKNQPKNIGI